MNRLIGLERPLGANPFVHPSLFHEGGTLVRPPLPPAPNLTKIDERDGPTQNLSIQVD